MSQMIIPKYKILMCYDIIQATNDQYYQFVVGEFVPSLQKLGIYMLQVYHTAYGNYPIRQLEFVAEDMESIRTAFTSDTYKRLDKKFKAYTTNYSQKIINFRDAFQF